MSQQMWRPQPETQRTGTAQGGQQGQQMMGQHGQTMSQHGGMAGGGEHSMGQQIMGATLDDALTGEMRLTLHDFVQSATACEWCADQCIDEGPQMAECIRLCRDVADLAALNVQFIARDSRFGPELAETFARAAEACAQECAQHPHAHCQECANVLMRAVESTWDLLASFDGQSQQAQIGGF